MVALALDATALNELHGAVEGAAGCSAPPAVARRRPEAAARSTSIAERAAMIEQHMPLVRYVAGAMARHTGQTALLEFDDLISYGVEGLIQAVDTFEPERGLKFSTWAVMHVRTTIQDAMRTLDPLPRGLRARAKEIDRVSAELAHERGCWPGLAEIAEAIGRPVDALRRTMHELTRTTISLEQANVGHDGTAVSGDEGGFGLLNMLADTDPEGSPEESLDAQELIRLLKAAEAALPAREALLVDAYYRRGQNMREVSVLLGISESRVSQLHARAVRLLREHLNAALWSDTGSVNSVAPQPVVDLSSAEPPAAAPAEKAAPRGTRVECAA